jgi:hypothetical protein
MGVGRLNIWISDVADACGTSTLSGRATIFDCDGILAWPCGRFRTSGTDWQIVPQGTYRNLPFRCGHLEAEVPPGCYWVVAGSVSPGSGFIHLNYTTHVGIVQVGCDEVGCVKLYNPSIRLCWNWFLVGARVLAARGEFDRQTVERLAKTVEGELLAGVPLAPGDRILEEVYADFIETGGQKAEEGTKGKKK